MPDDGRRDNRPPPQHQFKAGQSGCPDGGHKQRAAKKAARLKKEKEDKARKEKDLKRLVMDIFLEEHRVSTPRGNVDMPTLEVLLRNLVSRASKKDANDRDVARALKLAEKAGLLDRPSESVRPMVLVVNQIMEKEAWAKATEGELLSRNPLEGIRGAENLLLEGPSPRRGLIPDEGE